MLARAMPSVDVTGARGRLAPAVVACGPRYGAVATRLLDHGYEPLPIVPASKKPAIARWTSLPIDLDIVEGWSATWPGHGIGLRTGRLVGIDIDVLDPDLAHRLGSLAQARFGVTLTRIGLWPKRLLLYRTDAPFRKLKLNCVEILGVGQQFVAFGTHPDTGRAYDWPDGETPLDVALADLPPLGAQHASDFLGEIAALLPGAPRPIPTLRSASPASGSGSAPTRDTRGLVTDGRDGWLSTLAYHGVQDAIEASRPLDVASIAVGVWDRFLASTDLARPRQDRLGTWSPADAARKVADKLRLRAEGRLPPRDTGVPEVAYDSPTLSVTEARVALEAAIEAACDRIAAWHQEASNAPAPQIGLRATVGLGKSAVARRQVLALRTRLRDAGAPDRIAIFVPSHGLAEEMAAELGAAGASVAVLRGYLARHPILRQPMCRDRDAVDAAILSGNDVQSTACESDGGHRCSFFAGCLKQQNRAEVAQADIVVAPYDALFTGFATAADSLGLLLIDEACWSRAIRETTGLFVESFGQVPASALKGWGAWDRRAGAAADLGDLRRRAAAACLANGVGALSRHHLVEAGLTAEDCRLAIGLEYRLRQNDGLYAGMPARARQLALEIVAANQQVQRAIQLWRAIERLLESEQDRDGRVRILAPDRKTGLHPLRVVDLQRLHKSLRDKPILHLDATLRPDLARAILPRLETTIIEAGAPHMSVRLIAGSFGKSSLCPGANLDEAEAQRRRNRLQDCVDHVRWQARRAAPGRVLVVTYKDCEAAFAAIPGVDVAHFNAVAGLDAYRDVAMLIVIGRPLPMDRDLAPLSAAIFAQEPEGGYHVARKGVRLLDGTARSVRAMVHSDRRAEELRAAICDDELIQAVGRGRGVNRTAATPLEVHVLADVALPLVYAQVLDWQMEAPDLVQRMLLAGIAVYSPSDAAALHPRLFANVEQAKKAFQRTAFEGHFPIRDIHREMSLKSAAYRREGRGRGWQRAWWIDGSDADARIALTDSLGTISGWRQPDA